MRSLTIKQGIIFALLSTTVAAISSTALCAETIALKREQGTFVVPVVLNGSLTLNFTIDSGAADVSIPSDVVSTLVRTGTIENGDFIGSQQYQLADGSVQRERRFRIRSLRVGSIELRNVVASEAPQAGMPLLGQSFLARLPSWSIDNQRHVLVINQSAGSAGTTNASSAEAVKSEHPTPVKHHKQASPTEPEPAEQLAQQQCEFIASRWTFSVIPPPTGPIDVVWMQVCTEDRVKKLREYANAPADLLAQQHQVDCANMWARQLHKIEKARQEALYSQRTFGGKLEPCGQGGLSTCVADKRKILELTIGQKDERREDPCTEADLLSRGGAPE